MSDLSQTQNIGGISVTMTTVADPHSAQNAARQIKQDVERILATTPIRVPVAMGSAGGSFGSFAASPIATAPAGMMLGQATATFSGGAFAAGGGADRAYAMAMTSLAATRQVEVQKTQIVATESAKRVQLVEHEARATMAAAAGGATGGDPNRLFGLRMGRMGQIATIGFGAHAAMQLGQEALNYGNAMRLAGSDQHAVLQAELGLQNSIGGIPLLGQFAQLGATAIDKGIRWMQEDSVHPRTVEEWADTMADAARGDRHAQTLAKSAAFAGHARMLAEKMPGEIEAIGADPITQKRLGMRARRRNFEELAEQPEARNKLNQEIGPVASMRMMLGTMEKKESDLLDRQAHLLDRRVFIEKRVADISIEATKARLSLQDGQAQKLQRSAGLELLKQSHQEQLFAEKDENRRAGLEKVQADEITKYNLDTQLESEQFNRHVRGSMIATGGALRTAARRIGRDRFGAQMSDFDTETAIMMNGAQAWQKPMIAVSRFAERMALGSEHAFQIGQGANMLKARVEAANVMGDPTYSRSLQAERAAIIMDRASMRAELLNAPPELRALTAKAQLAELTTQRANLQHPGNEGWAMDWNGRAMLGDPLKALPGTLRRKVLGDELSKSIGAVGKDGPPPGWYETMITLLGQLVGLGNKPPQLP